LTHLRIYNASGNSLMDDSESPFWIKLTGKNALKAMDYDDIRIQIKKIAKRAGIKKPRNYPNSQS